MAQRDKAVLDGVCFSLPCVHRRVFFEREMFYLNRLRVVFCVKFLCDLHLFMIEMGIFIMFLMVIKRVYALLVVLLNLIEVILIRTESATEETAVL